jgi:hypothetical protein
MIACTREGRPQSAPGAAPAAPELPANALSSPRSRGDALEPEHGT